MKPEYCEPLAWYNILTNDDDELLIMLPGYYEGEPDFPVIWYDGKENAVFQRRKGEQCLLLDMVHKDMRPQLKKAKNVIIKEVDSQYEYYADVEEKEVKHFAKQALALHDYIYNLHPYPQRTGAFEIVHARCDICKRKTALAYRGELYPLEGEYTICPKCIASGKAAKRKNATFTAAFRVPIPGLLGDETILCNTPPIKTLSKSAPNWLCHCGKPAVYLGRVRMEDLGDKIWDEIVDNWDYSLSDVDVVRHGEIRAAVACKEVEGHLFRCSKCNGHLMFFC